MKNLQDCIIKYLKEEYTGGSIGISDLADYCSSIEGEVYAVLSKMKQEGKVEIVKKYYCPEFHSLRELILSENYYYCPMCDLKYCYDDYHVVVFINSCIS